MIDYEQAIKRPVWDINKFIVGVVLSFIPIVNLVVSGYGMHCASKTLKGDKSLPEWYNWVDLFIHGLVGAIVSFIYLLPSILIVVFSIGPVFLGILGALMVGDVAAVSAGLAAAVGGFVLVLLVAFILSAISFYLIPAALIQYVRDGYNIGSAFRFREILGNTICLDYFIVWVFVSIYCFIAFILLSFIPIVGTAVASFAVEVTSMTLFAMVYAKKTDESALF